MNPAEPTDAALIARCRDGDDAAWAELVDRHGGLVTAIARRQGLDASGADDVFQQTFIALTRSVDSMENPQGLVRWLITTATRIAQRSAASRRRQVGITGGERAEVAATVDPGATDAGSGADVGLERWEDEHRIQRALAGLGERCRVLLQALYGVGADPSYDRIAERLGIPRGSIGPTRARCLERLMASLAGSGEDSAAERPE